MRIKLIPLLAAGIEIPRGKLNDRYAVAKEGTLVVTEGTDQGRHRVMRIARFEFGELDWMKAILYDPQLLWINNGRFLLKGFERVRVNDKLVEYAQSWLCYCGTEPPCPPLGKR